MEGQEDGFEVTLGGWGILVVKGVFRLVISDLVTLTLISVVPHFLDETFG